MERAIERARPPDPDEGPRQRRRPRNTAAWLNWLKVKRHVKSCFGALRTLLFIHLEDERVCMRLRTYIARRFWTTAWAALRAAPNDGIEPSIEEAVHAMASHLPASDQEMLQSQQLHQQFVRLTVRLLRHEDDNLRPLWEKLPLASRMHTNRLFDHHYLDVLAATEPLADRGSPAWFKIRQRTPAVRLATTMNDLHVFAHTSTWPVDREAHEDKIAAFHQLEERRKEQAVLKSMQDTMVRDQRVLKKRKRWSSEEEAQHNGELAAIKVCQAAVKIAGDPTLILRTRKYRLMPTRKQRQQLKSFMGTCRFTYNQAVAHFKATGVYSASTLANLYVSNRSTTTRQYPDGMGPPPAWAHETASSFRKQSLRTFEANVTAAKTNFANGNINKFDMKFASRKTHRFFTISAEACYCKVERRQHTASSKERRFLSIPRLKNIRLEADEDVRIDGGIHILNKNGFWYAAIPQYVQPQRCEDDGSCVALDPGIKAFMTGMDLEGELLEIARDNQPRLDRLRSLRDNAQREMAKFRNRKGRTKRWRYKKYVRAKRAFTSATARLKNVVKDLHYKTCAYLTDRYQTILLLRFQTKEMVRRSCARNRRFNTTILSLNHYKFRQLLAAKCEVKGRCLKVCSEMYTSRTCGRCNHLHLRLGSNDVFTCPHCHFTAGRDANAAFNILRFVCAGSLQTFS